VLGVLLRCIAYLFQVCILYNIILSDFLDGGWLILSSVVVTYRGGGGSWFGWLDLLHLIHSQPGTAGNTALSLIYTLYRSPLLTH
jgi:hypothetical protein